MPIPTLSGHARLVLTQTKDHRFLTELKLVKARTRPSRNDGESKQNKKGKKERLNVKLARDNLYCFIIDFH